MHRNVMLGHMPAFNLTAGFMGGNPPVELGPSVPIISRGAAATPTDEQLKLMERLQALQRGEATGDVNQILFQLGTSMAEFQRAITSSTSAFPVRENLEAEAKVLVPLDTPIRNLLPRRTGSGTASAWKQITSLGGVSARAFFAESGAPADHATSYANKSASYKLLGTFGSVTGFAMAAGANFQNQLATEKTNAVKNLMLNEENALINGDSTSTSAPWGDGSNALAFDGLVNLIATGNGTPSNQVQTSVGALTTSLIDGILGQLYTQGAQGVYMIMNEQECRSLTHLAEGTGSIIRVMATSDGKAVLGVQVTGYVHPITGQMVDIYPSRYLAAGTILFGSKSLPDGSPAADVDVLPQVQLPQLAPNENVQGYTAQEIAPTTAAPQVYPFMVSVYEVLRMKSALHFAKATGVSAV
jgi:hypothetical protein